MEFEALRIKIAPSLMCADLSRLGEQVEVLDAEGVDIFHFDIMDGHFVPNLALSPSIIRSVRPLSKKEFDIHMMVTNPALYFDELYDIGVEFITPHIETLGSNAFRVLQDIHDHGAKAGIALNPATPLSAVEYLLDYVDKVTIMTVDPGFAGQSFIKTMLTKIQTLSNLRANRGYSFAIEVDGSINERTFGPVISAGADILVVGTSGLFSLDPDLRVATRKMLSMVAKFVHKSRKTKVEKTEVDQP